MSVSDLVIAPVLVGLISMALFYGASRFSSHDEGLFRISFIAKAGIVLMTAGMVFTRSLWRDGSFSFIVIAIVASFPALHFLVMPRILRSRKRALCLRDFPTLLDSVVLRMEAGYSIVPAFGQSEALFDEGSPVRQALTLFRRDMETGVPQAEAIDRMREKIDLSQAEASLRAIGQSMRLGTPLGPILREQSERTRENLLLAGEEYANALPMKLLIPLLLFIFPASFLIILSPVIVSFLAMVPR